MKTYYNTRTKDGVETIDEIDSEDFKSSSDYRKELKRLLREYNQLPYDNRVYLSKRATRDWMNR